MNRLNGRIALHPGRLAERQRCSEAAVRVISFVWLNQVESGMSALALMNH
jgi:hypothetical protein